MTAIEQAPIRRALELACRAPSAHNMQPWQVQVRGDVLSVLADPSRRLAHSDPSSRDLRLGLGAFVEAARIALGAEGIAADLVDPSPTSGQSEWSFATLKLVVAAAPEKRSPAGVVSLLRRRQSSRLPYSPREPDGAALEALVRAAGEQRLGLHLVSRASPERARLARWLFLASRESWLDPRAVAELRRWIRFDPEGARASDEGLSSHCLELSPGDSVGLMAMLRPEPWRLLSYLFAAPMLAEALARTDAEQLEQSPILGLLVDEHGSADPRAGVSVSAGGGLLRLWLAATELGLSLHPISVLLDRRGWEVAKLLGVAPHRVLFAFRLGRSVPPAWSGRRAVDRFARFEAR